MRNAPFTSAAIDKFGSAVHRGQFKIRPHGANFDVESVDRTAGVPDAEVVTVQVQNDHRNQTKLVTVVDYHGRMLYRGTFDL